MFWENELYEKINIPKKITKIEALSECVRIWRTLEKTGSRTKESVKGADKYLCECPACEYDITRDEPDRHCGKNCIIKWPGGSCDSESSHFMGWIDCDRSGPRNKKKRQHYAKLIADLAQKALDKEIKKKESKTRSRRKMYHMLGINIKWNIYQRERNYSNVW